MASLASVGGSRGTSSRIRASGDRKPHKVFTSPPIYDIIFSACSPAALCRISKVSAAARDAVRHYGARAFSVDTRLARFFDDPLAFRGIQAQYGALVSGSQALQLLDRTDYGRESDLDIYVSEQDACAIGAWLVSAGYAYRPGRPGETFATFCERVKRVGWCRDDVQEDQLDYDGKHGVCGLLRFFKGGPELHRTAEKAFSDREVANALKADPAGVEVQVVACEHSPLSVILKFHSTVVMNFFTWDCAYSLYPRATFEERRTLVLRENAEDVVYKYADRGFWLIWDSWEECPALRCGDRWVADRDTWILPLDTSGVPQPAGPSVDLTLNGWTLKKRTVMEPRSEYDDEHNDTEDNTDDEVEVEIDSGCIGFELADRARPKSWKLSATYTVPCGFYDAVRELQKMRNELGPHGHLVLDFADATGREGKLRMHKLAILRKADGRLDGRLLSLIFDPPSPPTLEEYIEWYDYYERCGLSGGL